MLLSANSGMHGPHPRSVRYTLMEAADFLADAGYDAMDVNFCPVIYAAEDIREPILDGDDWKKDLDALKEKCAQRGLATNITHLPYRFDYTNPEEPGYAQNHAMTVRAFQASEYIGAKWAVLHIRTVEGTVDYVKKLFADSGVTGTGIAIENIFSIPTQVLLQAHDALKAEGFRVGICLDVGHAHVSSVFKQDVTELIHTLGQRIQVLHIHDNFRTGDHHAVPYCGTIPWRKVMQALKEVGFTGELNYEMITSSLPDPLRGAYADYCVAVGRYLISLFDEYDPETTRRNSQ